MTAGFPHKWSKGEKDKNRNIFYNLSSEVTHCHLHKVPLDIQGSPAQSRRVYQGCEVGVKVITVILQAGHHGHSQSVGCCPAPACQRQQPQEHPLTLPAQPPDPFESCSFSRLMCTLLSSTSFRTPCRANGSKAGFCCLSLRALNGTGDVDLQETIGELTRQEWGRGQNWRLGEWSLKTDPLRDTSWSIREKIIRIVEQPRGWNGIYVRPSWEIMQNKLFRVFLFALFNSAKHSLLLVYVPLGHRVMYRR